MNNIGFCLNISKSPTLVADFEGEACLDLMIEIDSVKFDDGCVDYYNITDISVRQETGKYMRVAEAHFAILEKLLSCNMAFEDTIFRATEEERGEWLNERAIERAESAREAEWEGRRERHANSAGQ